MIVAPGPYFFHTCNYDSTGPLFLSYKFLHCYVYVRTMYIMCKYNVCTMYIMCMYNVVYGTADVFCSASHVYMYIIISYYCTKQGF